MNRILRVVGGPLRGSEIALVAGTKVSVGCGDACDILIADPTLGAVAFELDVTDEDVTILFPDGTAKTMLDYEAKEIGSSAFAVGPAEGEWQEIVWPERRSEELRVKSEESAEAKDGRRETEDKKPEDERQETEDKKSGSRVGCLLWFVIFLLLIVALGWLFWRFREDPRVASAYEKTASVRERAVCLYERSVALWRGWFPDRAAEAAKVETVRPKLSDVAAKYALALSETDGRPTLSGNFRTRQERLRATAEAYMAAPGTELDLTDDESLFTAADDLLRLVTDGRISVDAATNRVVVLKGNAASADALHDILVALNADVPGIVRADCRQVVCGSGKSEEEYGEDVPNLPGITRPPRKMKRSTVSPNLPICGILTTPYPCLIMKNGMRIMEGGEFGGCIVERITADAVTLRNNSGSFEWRP